MMHVLGRAKRVSGGIWNDSERLTYHDWLEYQTGPALRWERNRNSTGESNDCPWWRS
jgi:hypothetical protein